MAVVNLDQVHAGMALADDVRDRRGRLLMPKGRELTEKHLEAFRMWGVTSVDIEGAQTKEPPRRVFDEAVLARADWETDLLFTNAAEEHPFLKELRAIARLRVAESIADETWRAS